MTIQAIMKFALSFLACIAVIHAENYDFWCSHNFQVFPPKASYPSSLLVDRNWFTSKYYADCLVEFPQSETDGTCEDEQPDIEVFMAWYEIKLAAARSTIEESLNNDLAPFTVQVDQINQDYVNTFKQYIKNVHEQSSPEYTNKVAAYEEQILTLRNWAINNFNDTVVDVVSRIKTFHDEILARFRSCLETRARRVADYNTKMSARAEEMVNRYQTGLAAIVTKRVAFVKYVFDRLYADETKDIDHETAISNYSDQLTAESNTLVENYQEQVDDATSSLNDSYRCNYKCYFNTGCYGFSQKNYLRSWIQFPLPPKYFYRLDGVSAFKADWTGATFNSLRTCSEDEKNAIFDDESYQTDINSKVSGYKTDLSTRITEWQTRVAVWKTNAGSTLAEKIQSIMPKSDSEDVPTEAEVETFHMQLQAQAENWINLKEQELFAQIAAVESSVTNSINSWEANAQAYIDKIKNRFDSCVGNKNAKVASYQTCLENRRSVQRTELEARMNTLAAQHKIQFGQFYLSAFGEAQDDVLIQNLKTIYHSFVDEKVSDALGKFDTYWDEWKPKLEQHYECGFKCNIMVTIPVMNLMYNWDFCAPSTSLCKFYY